MDAHFLYQDELFENLKKAEKNFKKTPKERIKKPYLQTRLEILEQLWKDFKEGHKKIIESISKGDRNDSYFTDDVYEMFEELYVQYKTSLMEVLQPYLLEQAPRTSTPLSTSPCFVDELGSTSNCEVKLPRIQLPTFSGKYEEWQTFYDMFCSLIHNNKKLSQVQKLHYLKGNLTGEPGTLLRNYSVTEANYEEAWKQLVRRYDNKRYNSNAILKTLFTQRQVSTESASTIKYLLDTTSTCLKALQNMGIDTRSWDIIIIYLVVSKLDSDSMKQWEQTLSLLSDELPTWRQLEEFLEARFRSLEMIDTNKIRPTLQTKPITKSKVFHTITNEPKCAMCNGQHFIFHCKQFAQLSTKDRHQFVQTNNLCFNCLSPTHSVMRCRQQSSCRRCGRKHHSLLHFEKDDKHHANQSHIVNTPKEEHPGEPSQKETHIAAHFTKEDLQPTNVLLATALIKSCNRKGNKLIFKALLDQGSQASFVTEATAQLLGLKRQPVNGLVTGLGDGHLRTKHMVSLNLVPIHNPDISVQVNAFVLHSLTSLLPATKLHTPDWLDLEHVTLADPGFATPGKIDILLGADVFSDIILEGIYKHPEAKLVAQNTTFGWVLYGRMSREVINTKETFISMHIQAREDELLQRFWEMENEPNTINKRLTKTEEKCEEIYNTTTERNKDGRYVVRLPFENSDPKCKYGQSREIAKKRLDMLEKRLSKNSQLGEEYKNVLNEYLTLNHMSLVHPDEIDNPNAVYLPHHAVVRNDKETTRVRVVFDASCKGTNNVSLNDDLLVGPKLQQDSRHIVMRGRIHKIAIVADIIKMYRMVYVAEDDLDFQRIMWRPNSDEEIQHYKLSRLTFGTACAPYLAVKTLQRLAEDEEVNYPTAAAITRRDFYIDDLLSGGGDLQETINIYNEMTNLLRSGGFELQKWSSNSIELLKHIGEEKSALHTSVPVKIKNDQVKVLGLIWNTKNDTYEYTLDLPETKQEMTKREVLSSIARLYDPMGWIAPVVVTAKLYMQKLWKSGVKWDEYLPTTLLEEWLKYKDTLIHIKNISLPRWMQYEKDSKIELHAFADASKSAFAAVVYARVTNGHEVFVSLITAKTKVAPIEKEVSIPRLELCGAVLASKLLFEVAQVLGIAKENLYAWTDSTIVLAWLKGGSSRWATFVSNRVAEILNILDYERWGHVSTDMNPADCGSRGMTANELVNHSLWWRGPSWLSKPAIDTTLIDVEDTHEEEKIRALTVLTDTQEDFIWNKFSSYNRMLRVMSYCRRFLKMKLPKNERKQPNFITTNEIKETLQILIKQIQNFHFCEEIKWIAAKGQVSKKSDLRTLCPILDQDKILRVGGRIDQSHYPYDTRHPIILPAKNHLTELILLNAHQITLHGGPQNMLNYVRSKFWIIQAKNQCKKVYRKCVTCARYSKTNTNQLMGQIPEVRLKPSKPFKSAGVDYAGPINIRLSPGRGLKSYKGYICLFVCMVTRAIHLEAVTDLTAKGFIAAFRRFTSRRGHCADLYSDNGTNFVGANKQLRDMLIRANSLIPEEISKLLTLAKTTWHFIPPHAPNFGGLWEAGIKSTKTHLVKVIGEATLTYEELSTTLAQVEACLNSRPITLMSSDSNDPLPLTPGHFLIGEPLLNIADEDYSKCNVSGLDRWRLTQKIVNDFWKRWSREYLVNLNQHYKWNFKKSEPQVGDIVILKEENIPPAKWVLGKIIKKHPGPDNITRVVTIQHKGGEYKRPLSKICVLPK